jgi:streptomycin 3"-adenylyltransferase
MIAYPDAVQALLDHIEVGFRHILTDNLIGIYLHGSLTMGGFNPRTSDVDFLVVVETPLEHNTREVLAALSLDLEQDAPPKGIEYSIVLRQHAQHFSYPTPFEFHYSHDWHDRFVTGEFDFVHPRVDSDLAAHFVITRTRGHALTGLPIVEVFGQVPERDYWASISADAVDDVNKLL